MHFNKSGRFMGFRFQISKTYYYFYAGCTKEDDIIFTKMCQLPKKYNIKWPLERKTCILIKEVFRFAYMSLKR